ncbi:CBS domain-containing protein [Microbispora triticiradicis]|uniref:CBS domain-containing protein n=2 Tax=Microbispora TaxID=2005 RepID=A0ABY3M1L5_9ACTN|nr:MULTISPECIES: CBS domain-containing protein [Microbispora]TLP59686.1 CBS domain-containing protein [Microbispora fusca]TYB63400.1 CBS domain-containing protein [Microbispora tritici]
MTAKVKDVMGRVAIAVRMDASFADLVATMRRFGVGAVTVIDADRRPVGVVSEDDMLLKEIDLGERVFSGPRRRVEQRKAAGANAGQIMTRPAITVTGGTPVRDAARLMHRNRVKQLPVIDAVSGRIVGTVHQGDLLRVFARPAAEIRAEIERVVDRMDLDIGDLDVNVSGGVVTIKGQVPRRSAVKPLLHAVRRVEGVVEVDADDLAFLVDDLLIAPPLL